MWLFVLLLEIFFIVIMLYDGVVDDDDDDVDDDTSLPTTPCWRHGELLAVLPDVSLQYISCCAVVW